MPILGNLSVFWTGRDAEGPRCNSVGDNDFDLGIHDGELELGAGDDLTVHGAGGDGGAYCAPEAENFGVDEEGVTRHHGLTEFDFVGAQKVANFISVVWHAHDEDGSGLGHSLKLEDAGHDGVSGKVPLEKVLVHGEVLDGGAFHLRGETGDAIDEQEWIAVREDFKDLGDVEDSFCLWEFDGRNHGTHGGIVFAKGFCGFGVGPVAGFDGDNVAREFASREHEVTDEV